MSGRTVLAGVLSSTLVVVYCGGPSSESEPVSEQPEPFILRVATFNIEDLRTEEVSDP